MSHGEQEAENGGVCDLQYKALQFAQQTGYELVIPLGLLVVTVHAPQAQAAQEYLF